MHRRKPTVRVGCSRALQREGGKGLAGDGVAADRDTLPLSFLGFKLFQCSLWAFCFSPVKPFTSVKKTLKW